MRSEISVPHAGDDRSAGVWTFGRIPDILSAMPAALALQGNVAITIG